MGGKRIRDLNARVRRECSISRKLARFSSGGIQSAGIRGGSHSVGRCRISKRTRNAAEREAP